MTHTSAPIPGMSSTMTTHMALGRLRHARRVGGDDVDERPEPETQQRQGDDSVDHQPQRTASPFQFVRLVRLEDRHAVDGLRIEVRGFRGRNLLLPTNRPCSDACTDLRGSAGPAGLRPPVLIVRMQHSEGICRVDTENLDVAPEPAARADKHRGRRIIAATLAVLAALTTTFAVTGGWVRRTTIDTNHWVDTVGPLASDPKVQAALAQWSTEQLSQLINVEGYLQDALPKRGQILAGPLSSAIDGFIETEATKFFASDAFAKLWIAANRVAHERVIKVLKGESDVVKTRNGKVVIDFMPLLVRILQNVDQRANGLLSADIPALDENLTGDEIRAKISDTLNRPIPDDFGTVAVFDDSELSTIQQAVQWFQQFVIAFFVLAFLFIAGAILVAPDRRRIAIWLGLGTAITLASFARLRGPRRRRSSAASRFLAIGMSRPTCSTKCSRATGP